ncbi:MAG: hypothetical protein LBG97_07325 [Coriobacteriales bacterium]|nr:hypothetical protein [Coriobacteriales bacterium]
MSSVVGSDNAEAMSSVVGSDNAEAMSSVVGSDNVADRFCANAQIVLYRLSSKVVSMEENVSDRSKEVAYYTLAVGHHTGVLDCFTAAMSFSYAYLQQLLCLLPKDCFTHYKLDGLRKFGEITIASEHAQRLIDDLNKASMLAQMQGADGILELIAELGKQLQLVLDDPVVYLVAKRLL